MHILTLVMINYNCLKTSSIWSLISSTAINKDIHPKLMTMIFIMQDKAKSFILLSMLSTPEDSTLSNTKVKTFESIKQKKKKVIDGHPALKPILIQNAHLQPIHNDWSKMTLNPSNGLEILSPKSSNNNQH